MKKICTQILVFLSLCTVCYLALCFIPGTQGHTHTITETLSHMAPCKAVLSTAISGAVILAHACVTEKEWE